MELFNGTVGSGTLALLFVCLGIALAFEFINGFHDTANAVATVIYTKSLPPWAAVTWSGFMNLCGVMLGGTAVAFSIVHLLPVDLLINIGATAGIFMVLSLLISAIIWNFGTWYFGLPASSSHSLIGAILGVGLASSLFSGAGFGSGVNWAKAKEVGLSLLVSPLLGFVLAALVLLICRALLKNPKLYKEPEGDQPPPFWIRCILFLTCTGVSFAHGSNDGQKGVGLIMLILIGLVPAQFAINGGMKPAEIEKTLASVRTLQQIASHPGAPAEAEEAIRELQAIQTTMQGQQSLRQLSPQVRRDLRIHILRADDFIGKLEKATGNGLSTIELSDLKESRAQLRKVVDYVVPWVVIAVAISLGFGTTIGWKRIVVTVGEKIGKQHLTYAQGASAELVAAITIAIADHMGLPVSTTHVLSSGVAGTMAANRSGLQMATVRNIALAWVLTLPMTMLIAGPLFAITAGSSMRAIGAKARIHPHEIRTMQTRTLPIPPPPALLPAAMERQHL